MPPKSHQFAAYVPALILRHFGHDPAPPAQAEGDHFPAVALFADIAGSTKITNELTRLGRLHGPEEMYRILNAYYEPLVWQLKARGGDVIGFAGDAVLAVWPVKEGESLRPAARQGTQAALEVQRDLNNMELAPGVRLTMRVCLGAGELSTALVGGRQGFWQMVASGPPLDQIRAAGSIVRIGEVFISREVRDALGEGVEWEPQPDGGGFVRGITDPPAPPDPATLPDVTTLPEECLRPFVQRAVQESIDAGMADYLDQSRTVSVLFVRLGRRAGEAPSYHRVQEAMSLVQDAAAKYEGTVAQFIEDDKGLIALLAFGLPMVGHEDDPRRAIEAAVYLQEPAHNRGLPCAIGASTGLPFCGALGSPNQRVVYTVTGADVVRAARLMQLAHYGEILCDEDTHDAASKRSQHRYITLPRFSLKGYDVPARVFQVIGGEASRIAPSRADPDVPLDDEAVDRFARERLHADRLGERLTALLRERAEGGAAAIEAACDRLLAEDVLVTDHGVCELTDKPIAPAAPVATSLHVPLIGRASERAVIATSLDAVLGGASRVTFVEGDTGSGKSRMMEEAQHLAAERDMLAAVGHCSSVEASTPYYPWRAVFENLLDLTQLADQGARGERVLAALPPDLQTYAALLNDFLSLAIPQTDATSQMTGQTRADNLNAALIGLLASAVGGRPTLIVLEDVHWADASSWRLMKLVRERLDKIALALSIRHTTDTPPAEYDQFTAAEWTDRVALDSLSEEDTREFARAQFGAERIADPLARLVWRRTQGNPLFIEQITGHLAGAGMVTVEEGTADLRGNAAGANEPIIPDTIRGLITARIDRLSPTHQLTAKVSSVIGPLFAVSALKAIYPDRNVARAVPEHIHTLTNERLLRQERTDPDPVYDFPHPILQQVCYELLTRPQRQQLHHSAAEWYQSEQLGGGAHYRLIAHHWGRAGAVDKQAEFLAEAGDAALRDGAFREAATGFTEVLQLSRDRFSDNPPPEEVARRAHWEHQLGESHFGLGDLPTAAEHLRDSLALRGRTFRTSTAGLVVDTALQFVRQLARRLWPRARGAGDDEELREVAATYLRLGRISYYTNDILPGTNAILRALNVAERVGPSPELALAYASVTILTGMLNWHRAARVYAQLAESVVHEVGGSQDRCIILAYLSMYHLGQGHWEQVDTLAREALGLAEQISDHQQRSEVSTILAMLNCFRADYGAAMNWTATIIDGANRSGNTMHLAWAANIIGECAFRQGRTAEAVDKMNESAAALAGNKDRTEEIRIEGMLAGLAARNGELGEADRHADAAEAVARQTTGITCSTLEGFAGVAEARFARAKREPQNAAARKAAKAALKALKKYAKLYPIGRPRVALYEGRMHVLCGSPARALRTWRDGQSLAVTLRVPLDEAILHDALARSLPADSPERHTHVKRALSLYEQVGAASEGDRLRDAT